jgi:hypothetical protein
LVLRDKKVVGVFIFVRRFIGAFASRWDTLTSQPPSLGYRHRGGVAGANLYGDGLCVADRPWIS